MEALEKCLNQIRVPSAHQNIYKDECVYTFDSPETPTGLYVSLTSFLGYGEDHVKGYYEKTKNAVFLHIRREKHEIPQENVAEGPEKKITRLAIGVEGGFDVDAGKKRYEYEDFYNIVVFPEKIKFPYPDKNLPIVVQDSVKAILDAESALKKFEKEALTGTWDGEIRQVSKYAKDLKQLNNNKKIPPSGWKCEKCDLTNNLWLNLTDGSIMCGRKFFDGSGGNNHAVEHYRETAFPLAVKLGTITPDGKADVYSYAEDDMVEDPYLANHLAHFGIKIANTQKTEKSMVELELDLNSRVGEWSILTESNSKLIPLSGPGYTGMKNLGNSCYLNSVMQVMFSITEFIERFVNNGYIYLYKYPEDPANDFNVQMTKLGNGLWSGKYSSVSDTEETGIAPIMFKNLIGKNHPDFSTKNQQDAQEFFLHLINTLEKNTSNCRSPGDALKFCVEERVECQSSKKVKYTKHDEWCLSLPIPMHLATNADEVREYQEKANEAEKMGQKLPADSLVRPHLTLQSCLDTFAQSETVEQFYSTAIKDKTTAKKITRLATMPNYLMLHLKKFTLREDWTPIKLDVSVDMPDYLDLTNLRGHGLQPNEELLPEVDGEEIPPPQLDQVVINQLIEMGFPPEACKRAVFFSENVGLEDATQWIMDHIGDSDFADPFIPPGTEPPFKPNEAGLEMLINMGFSDDHAIKALKKANNDVERATDWIFSHQDELEAMEVDDVEQRPRYRDGGAKYRLKAFISHMSSSSQVGHYVCHIQRDNQWVIFNDSKVAISQNPPKQLGYLYLYQRA